MTAVCHFQKFARWALYAFIVCAAMQLIYAQEHSPAAYPALTFTYSSVTVPGSPAVALYAVNNSGNMVGTYSDSAGLWHGLLISGGKVKKIDHPGAAVGTFIYGINATGVLAGYYQDAVSTYGFTYSGGKFTPIIPSAGAPTQVYGINDKGQVTGAFFDANLNKRRAFFGTPAAGYTVLDAPNSTATLAWGINNSGTVSLVWQNTAGLRNGAIYSNKKFTTVNVPGAKETLMRGINTAGDLTMAYIDATGASHGALRTGGKFYKFSDPAMPNGTRPTGINDKRTMVGNRLDGFGNFTASAFKVTY